MQYNVFLHVFFALQIIIFILRSDFLYVILTLKRMRMNCAHVCVCIYMCV